ncbi:MAG: ABC transporter ATP-binding protein [Negativicutes bacterium]|nr:ABC transporter ATP-binding protein [Negativicutes bacterium]
MNSNVAIQFQNVTKRFDSTPVVDNITLQISRGSFTTLLGPSGCGKTTLMRLAAGFYEADGGEIFIDGRPMNGVPPHKRNTPLVFQDYALFPHMTVYRNIAYGLELLSQDSQEIASRVSVMVNMLGLAGLESRFPKQLSGGQQQRVALARALAVNSGLVLLDEPLSNLDAKLRVEVRVELRRLQQELGITNIYVTHDQDEALSMSDVIVVMRKGKIEQIGSPQEIYFRPCNQFVADFVGTANFITATVTGRTDSKIRLKNEQTDIVVENHGYSVDTGETVHLVIRPEAISLNGKAAEENENVIRGQIKMSSFLGAKTRYWIGDGLREYVVDDYDLKETLPAGSEAILRLDGSKVHLLQAGQMEGGGGSE